jgi:hypothetical protein
MDVIGKLLRRGEYAEDEKEYEIVDPIDEWEVLENKTNELLTPEALNKLEASEKAQVLEKECDRLRARCAGDWNKKGIDTYKVIKDALKIHSGMKDDQVNFACTVLTEAMQARKKKGDILKKADLSDLVTELKTKLDTEYGSHKWHCMIGRKMSFHLTSSSYINFYFKEEDMTVVMFKAYQPAPTAGA